MNRHLWVCSYNPHHQIYIRNRTDLKRVTAELRKSSLASVCQDLWKHQAESCLLLVNHDCCWKTANSSAGFVFIVMFLEYKGTTGDLVNALQCGAADRRDQPPSASAVTTLCTWTPQALCTDWQVCWDNLRWRLVWETMFRPGCQAQLHWTVTVPPVSWQNPRFLFHSESYD